MVRHQASIATPLKSRTYHPVDDDIKEYISNTVGHMDNYTPTSTEFKCMCMCTFLCLWLLPVVVAKQTSIQQIKF